MCGGHRLRLGFADGFLHHTRRGRRWGRRPLRCVDRPIHSGRWLLRMHKIRVRDRCPESEPPGLTKTGSPPTGRRHDGFRRGLDALRHTGRQFFRRVPQLRRQERGRLGDHQFGLRPRQPGKRGRRLAGLRPVGHEAQPARRTVGLGGLPRLPDVLVNGFDEGRHLGGHGPRRPPRDGRRRHIGKLIGRHGFWHPHDRPGEPGDGPGGHLDPRGPVPVVQPHGRDDRRGPNHQRRGERNDGGDRRERGPLMGGRTCHGSLVHRRRDALLWTVALHGGDGGLFGRLSPKWPAHWLFPSFLS